MHTETEKKYTVILKTPTTAINRWKKIHGIWLRNEKSSFYLIKKRYPIHWLCLFVKNHISVDCIAPSRWLYVISSNHCVLCFCMWSFEFSLFSKKTAIHYKITVWRGKKSKQKKSVRTRKFRVNCSIVVIEIQSLNCRHDHQIICIKWAFLHTLNSEY